MSDIENFKALVANSPDLLARWADYSDTLIAEAEGDGITITKEDLATLSSVRIYAISGQTVGDWKAEAYQNLPAFRAAQELRELQAALADERDNRHVQAVETISNLSPEERLRRGREMSVGKVPDTTAPSYSASERASLVAQAERMRGGQKVAFARKHGLL